MDCRRVPTVACAKSPTIESLLLSCRVGQASRPHEGARMVNSATDGEST